MTPFRFDDPDLYVNGTPYDAFAQLRRESPFAWHVASTSHGGGFWLATKHRDVIQLSKDPELFATNAPLLADPLPMDLWPMYPALAMIADNLMTFDHKKHNVFRPLGNCLFSGTKVRAVEARIRSSCTKIIEKVCKRARFDLASEVALATSVEVVLGVFLGIPKEDLATVTRCVLVLNAMDDPVFRPTREAVMEAAKELFAYGLALFGSIESSPSNGIIDELIHNSPMKETSAERLFLAYWFPLAAGAFDTTASAIAGGTQALLEYPEQLSLLLANPDLIPLAVDEMYRWVSPVIYFRRTATADTSFKGNYIRRGQKIVLCYASANRDEDAFANPNHFDVSRSPNNHVSFGYGPHYCLGARLSSAILRIFFEEFLPHIPDMEIEGDVLRTRSAWMNRIRYMPVRIASTASV